MNLWGSCCLICSFQCSLYCLFFFLLTYIVPPSSIFRFRLPIWYTTLFHLPFLVTHLLYHPLPFTVSGYPFGIPPSSIFRFWLPIWYTTLFHLTFQVTHLAYHPLPFTVSGYPFGIPPSSIYHFWTHLVSSNLSFCEVTMEIKKIQISYAS